MKEENHFHYRKDDFFRDNGHITEEFYVNRSSAGDERSCFHLNLYLESEWRNFHPVIPPQPESSAFIGLILSGRQHRMGESGSRILEPGDVLIDRTRNEMLRTKILQDAPLKRIGLEITRNSAFETFCCTLFPEPVTVIRCGNPEMVRQIMQEIRTEIVLHGGRAQILSTAIFSLMQELSSQYARHGLPEPLCKALEMIRNNAFRPLSREQLAAEAGVSIRKLTELFQKHLGTSPGQYMIQRRINYAAELLKTGRFPVKEAARLSGFNSSEFFIREFKKLTGITPGKFKH